MSVLSFELKGKGIGVGINPEPRVCTNGR